MTGFILTPGVVPTKLEGPTVFLAGPVHATIDWQSHAIYWLRTMMPHVNVATPRNGNIHPDVAHSMYVSAPVSVHMPQYEWETKYLNEAARTGVIMFWLATEKPDEHECGRSHARTTRYELAEWKERYIRGEANIVIGAEPGFEGLKYIERRLAAEAPDLTIWKTLAHTLAAVHDILMNYRFKEV